MSHAARTENTVGVAVGAGTGPELATVFTAALDFLTFGAAGTRMSIRRCPRLFRTYGAFTRDDMTPSAAHAAAEEDAAAYVDWVRGLAGDGVAVVFRTAINAQSLYLVRERLQAVKHEVYPRGRVETLLVRDQTQGFYTGTNSDPAADDEQLIRTCTFSRQRTERVLDHALETAERRWGGRGGVHHVAVAYKFHLLDRRFARWVLGWARARDVSVQLMQPDTTNRNLLRDAFPGNLLLVGANEWADVMHTELIARHGLGSQEDRFSENVYLAPEARGLVEYQTVHGSADDIGGRNLVNPFATLRAAADIAQRFGAVSDARTRMESAIAHAIRHGVVTPDAGGRASTDEVLATVRSAYERSPAAPSTAKPATGSPATGMDAPDGSDHAAHLPSPAALLILDMQNDFCAPEGRFARLGLIDPAQTAEIAARIERLTTAARQRGLPVVFVHMVVDESAQPEVVRRRIKNQRRQGYLAPGSWGAAAFGVEPAAGERIFIKTGYDPFHAPGPSGGLDQWLRAAGVTRLILAGTFADLCVDATARSAYQKGFEVTVVKDATLGLERPTADALAFMTRFYEVALVDSDTALP